MTSEDDPVVLDMGLSAAEIRRVLAQAMPDWPWRDRADGVEATIDGRAVSLTIEPRPERRIALVVLPVTRLTLRFAAFAPEQRAAFLAAFARAFHRGGG